MTWSKQLEPHQEGQEKETESIFCINVLHTKEDLHFAFCNYSYSLASISAGSTASLGSGFL